MLLLCPQKQQHLEKICKFNKNAQNNYFYVKIDLWILTTNFTNTANMKNRIKKQPYFMNGYVTLLY